MGSLTPRAALRLLSHWSRIHARLRRLGIASHDVDDVAAMVLFAAAKAWPSYDPEKGSVHAWFEGITRNQASHHRESAYVRRERPRGLTPWPSGEEEPEAARSPPEDELDARRELDVVLAAFVKLPALEREVLERVIAGDSMADLADSLNRPISTLYKALYRARATLEHARRRARIARHG